MSPVPSILSYKLNSQFQCYILDKQFISGLDILLAFGILGVFKFIFNLFQNIFTLSSD